MKIKLTGRIPSKKNSKIISCRGSRPMMFPSAKHKEWHTDAMKQLAGYKLDGLESFKNGTKITITFFFPDNRKSDLTNKAESVMDLLVDFGIIEDDSWICVPDLHLKFGGVDKELSGCLIEY